MRESAGGSGLVLLLAIRAVVLLAGLLPVSSLSGSGEDLRTLLVAFDPGFTVVAALASLTFRRIPEMLDPDSDCPSSKVITPISRSSSGDIGTGEVGDLLAGLM